MSLEKILIVEDESVVRNLLRTIFERHGYLVSSASTIAEATTYITRDAFDLVMLDLRLPDGDGQNFLERLTALAHRPLVVMVTGHGTIESAVSCMRAGAFDYVLKPFFPNQIDVILRKAHAYRQLLSVNQLLSDDAGEKAVMLPGGSPAMIHLRSAIDRVATTDATVMITGESGTGKEVIARECYRRSSRRNQAFIKVNCAAISEKLIESEFFGHERGAFTGATERREGRFELANHGTLLLDEVSEIPANLQAKLLRVLQEREFERVGGSRTIKVNVRIIATSNRDIMSYVQKGDFRQDLYYRLNVFPVHLPSLRERPEDIPGLAEHFLQRFVRKHGIRVTGFSDSAWAAMMAYRWPGNVRELQNMVERAIILSESGRPVAAASLGLPTDLAFSTEPPPEIQALNRLHPLGPRKKAAQQVAPIGTNEPSVLRLDEVEKQAIREHLRQSAGNRTDAATSLGISVRTLRNKLQQYREAGDSIEELTCDDAKV